MSVLYPLTLRTYYIRPKSGKINSAFKSVLIFLIASISFNGLFAQEVSKEQQNRKEVEQKKQEAAELEAKINANPTLKGRLELKDKSTQPAVQLSADQEKKLIKEKEQIEANKLAAERKTLSLPGVEYKIIPTAGGQVEYIVTNANNVIYRQQVTSTTSLYNRQVQAE